MPSAVPPDPTSEADSAAIPAGEDFEVLRLSVMLNRIAGDTTRERIAVGDLLSVMRERAFGPLILIFALPNVLPTPPGTSAVLGAPLVFLTAQLALGLQPWLPGFIANRSLPRKDFAAFILRATPWLAKAENLLKPRLRALALPPAEYVIGVMCFILAAVLVLPIPLGNMLPALSLCVLSLAVLERDGVWVVIGTLLGIASLGVVSGVIWGFVQAGLYLLRSVFG